MKTYREMPNSKTDMVIGAVTIDNDNFIKQVRQDAFSAGKLEGRIEGMTEAVRVIKDKQLQLWEICSAESEACRWLERAIETARDAKKQKPSSSFYGTTECNEDIEPDTKKD